MTAPVRARTFPDLIGQLACWRNLGRKSLAAVQSKFVSLDRSRDWIAFPMYHFILDDERAGFDAHLRYMRQNGDFISIDDAVTALQNPAGIGGRYFCVTFDDGVKNCVTNALPILVEHDCRAVFFIATDYIGLTLERDWPRIHPFPQPYTGFRAAMDFMTWDDCREAHAAGVTLGAHTCRHVRLKSLDDDAAERELRESKAVLEREIGVPCRHFAAPWGVPGADFDPAKHPSLAQNLGFRSFLTTAVGFNYNGDSPLSIRRFGFRGFNWTSQIHCLMAAAHDAA